jgi:hypothetical protein
LRDANCLKAISLRTIIQLGQADAGKRRASLGGTRRKTGKEESEEAAAQNERGLGKGEGKGKARSWRTSGGERSGRRGEAEPL